MNNQPEILVPKIRKQLPRCRIGFETLHRCSPVHHDETYTSNYASIQSCARETKACLESLRLITGMGNVSIQKLNIFAANLLRRDFPRLLIRAVLTCVYSIQNHALPVPTYL